MESKKIIGIMGAIIAILIGVIIFLVINNNVRNNNNSEISDAVKFSMEYDTVDENNVFIYTDIDKIINVLENETGIVYLGFPECQWCKEYVVYLNEVAKSRNISTIYYYNIKEDRANNSENYLKLVDILKEYLQKDENGNPRIYVPAVIFVSNGNILGFDDETSLDTLGHSSPSEYWTDEEVKDLKSRLNSYIDDINICIDCNS